MLLMDIRTGAQSIMSKSGFIFLKHENLWHTVDPRYLDFSYLEQPHISKRKSDLCFNIEI